MNQFAAQMVGKMVQDKVGDAVKEHQSWFSLDSIKDYFDVTNTYVLHKLRIILFPFTVK